MSDNCFDILIWLGRLSEIILLPFYLPSNLLLEFLSSLWRSQDVLDYRASCRIVLAFNECLRRPMLYPLVRREDWTASRLFTLSCRILICSHGGLRSNIGRCYRGRVSLAHRGLHSLSAFVVASHWRLVGAKGNFAGLSILSVSSAACSLRET
jgi:hypothetical protein